jgi:hypothetical protein
MNNLEAQLRSWIPRHPSPRLERSRWRVAPSRQANHERQPSLASRWADWPGVSRSTFARVGVPALGCLALTATILMQPGEGLIVHNVDQPAMIALAMSNQNFAPYLSGSFQPTANRLDTFGWTNGGASPSSMGSLTPPEAIDFK